MKGKQFFRNNARPVVVLEAQEYRSILIFISMKHLIASILLLVSIAAKADKPMNIILLLPGQMAPGQELNAEVIINKGSLSSYGYLELELPAGFEAQAGLTDNSDFSFDAGKIRFTWMRMPAKDQLRVGFRLQAPSDTSAIFRIQGSFNYLVMNKRGQQELRPAEIAVGTPEQIRQLFERRLRNDILQPGLGTHDIVVKREKPDYTDFDKSYTVILLVKKGKHNYPLTIEEALPEGYQAEAIQTVQATFTASKGKAVFEWSQLPDAEYFTVSYLARGKDYSPQFNFDVEGKYRYEKGGRNTTASILKNYGEGFEKPSLQEIEQRNIDRRLDSLRRIAPPIQPRDTSRLFFFRTEPNPAPTNPPNQPNNSINEIKGIFN